MYKVFCDDQLLYLPGDQELVILIPNWNWRIINPVHLSLISRQ